MQPPFSAASGAMPNCRNFVGGSLAAYGNIRNRVEQGGVVEYCTEMQNRCSDGSGAGVNLTAMNNL